ncbi:helix-turn-helix protein [Flavobacterium sp. ACN2]|jgi:transcriptional regulator with XRE-family HTH domain|uniref:helix-turn-helix domain-containing protein n=1 Tax=unclassified Flavobacterium TaxID=196869 RepID=UPI000BB35C4B|nr:MULTISPECIES: helix-turn-helix transcriptional regulator [unclassified Flavobacterium]MDY0989542.1 helix-turn-helix transcriptional regulator [Flavobacterium sp. CFBP9031]PBI87927.1 helix-turn-helix protein [Flavobacterium sp. ACN2]
MSTLLKSNHIGRKISRIRELKDMKQEALAQALGTNQQAISAMENSENVDEEKLIQVAKALGVSVEAIKNFSEEAIFNIIGNTINNNDNASMNSNIQYQPTFNPLDKVVELYERLVQAEKDKVEYLEKLLKGR